LGIPDLNFRVLDCPGVLVQVTGQILIDVKWCGSGTLASILIVFLGRDEASQGATEIGVHVMSVKGSNQGFL
jgi:hypothetical protein